MDKKSMLITLGASLSLGLATASHAEQGNTFQAEKLKSGYNNVDGSFKIAEGKCGAGKCGAGKCGADKMKDKMKDKKNDGTCADKKKDASCGDNKDMKQMKDMKKNMKKNMQKNMNDM